LSSRQVIPVSELFDYVAGTSTGGILALGLGLRRPEPGDALYGGRAHVAVRRAWQHIFSRSFFHMVGALGNLNGPKYPEHGVDDVLKTYFAGMRLRDARTKRTGASLRDRAEGARSSSALGQAQAKGPRPPRMTSRLGRWLAATSAAPTFFPPHRAHAADGQAYALIDGGMYANNPALCAWVEAHDRHPDAEILVVSLGTGTRASQSGTTTRKTGALPGGAPHLIDVHLRLVSAIPSTLSSMRMLNTGLRRSHFRFQTDLNVHRRTWTTPTATTCRLCARWENGWPVNRNSPSCARAWVQ